MWTTWTTVVVFAIALGQLFFSGIGWDRYALVILILGLMGLLVLLYGPGTLRASRAMAKAGPELEPPHEGEDAARRRIAGVQRRLGELRARHPWCKTLP